MNVTCPSCGADMDLDVLLAHEDSRRALARLCELSLPLARPMLQYLRLFKPAKRAMGHGRTVKLLEELLPDVQRGAIERNGREWTAPLDTWRSALEQVLQRRDDGKLTLPLKTHGYLYEVLMGLADKAEAVSEREREQQRKAAGRTHVDGPAPVAAALQVPQTQRPAIDYSKPSRAALEMQARIKAARERKTVAADETDASEAADSEGAQP